ncbi:MAG: hypothetical protein WBI32_00680 [Halanaerobiales bacterium]
MLRMNITLNFEKELYLKDGGSMLIDDRHIFVLGNYLYKIDKNTAEIKYKIDSTMCKSNYLIRQNQKYLFGDKNEIICKETGKYIGKIKGHSQMPLYFGVSDQYIVYCDNNKLIVLDLYEFNKLWEKDISIYYSFEPKIKNDLLYIFLDSFTVMDIKTGDILWKDEIRDDFIEYVPQIIITEKYVGVYVEKGEESILRIYKYDKRRK